MKSAARPKDTPPAPLKLADDLDVFSIGRSWEALCKAAHTCEGDLNLDLSGIEDLDLCGIQALAVVDKALKGRGARLVLFNVRAEWQERIGTLGLSLAFAEPAP